MSDDNPVFICPHCGWQAYSVAGKCSHCKEDIGTTGLGRGVDGASATSRSPVVDRYRDGYRVSRALVTLGNGIKIIGAILGGVIFLGALISSGNQSDGLSVMSSGNQFDGLSVILTGIFGAAISGGLFWVCGVFVAALGQILRATLDTAVASSRFLNDSERADAMGIDRSVAHREVA